MARQHKRTRRSFLRGAGGLALAIPTFASLGQTVHASGETPKRLFVFSVMQTESLDMLPPGGPGALDLSDTYLRALQPYADRSLLISNLFARGGHGEGVSGILTGRPNPDAENAVAFGGPSVDMMLAERWRGSTPLPHLTMARTTVYGVGYPNAHLAYTDDGAPVPPDFDPQTVFEKIYGPVGGVELDANAEAAERQRALRSSILDSTLDDYRRLNARLSREDARRLDAHLTALRDQESAIQSMASFSCDAPDAPPTIDHLDVSRMTPALLGLAAGAFRCGATRIGSYRCTERVDSYHFLGIPDSHHNIAHNDLDASGGEAQSLEWHAQIRDWQAQQLLALVESLASTPEIDGDGSMLDNSAVVWLPEMGIEDHFHHKREHMPAFIIGGAGGALQTGRYFDASGYHYHDFLITLSHAMGCTDITSFGDEGTRAISEVLA